MESLSSWNADNAIIYNATTPVEIFLLKLVTLKAALRLEAVGMKHTRMSAVRETVKLLKEHGRDITQEVGWPHTTRRRASFLYDILNVIIQEMSSKGTE